MQKQTSEKLTSTCSECGTPVSFHRRSCHVCEADIGFPNVRKAKSEENELKQRYDSAIASSTARGVFKQIDDFEKYIANTKAVIARPIEQVIQLVSSDNNLYTTFAKQIRQDARIAEDNSWDRSRDSVESAIHPQYDDQIVYAALTGSDLGVEYYGNCQIVFKSELIEKRTSVFEENPFLFMVRHNIVVGSEIPKGYRATWANRGLLAVSKLHSKIDTTTKQTEYQGILISDEGGNADFIEVHIYGAIHARAFSKITLIGQQSAVEQALMQAHKQKFQELGIQINNKAA